MPISEPGPKFRRGDLVDVQGTSVHPSFRGAIDASHEPSQLWANFSYTVRMIKDNPLITVEIMPCYRVAEPNIRHAPAIDRLAELA